MAQAGELLVRAHSERFDGLARLTDAARLRSTLAKYKLETQHEICAAMGEKLPPPGDEAEAARGTLDAGAVQAMLLEVRAMVGADEDVFARVEPVIGTWAKAVVRIGGPGSGHKMKLLNNFLAMGYGAIYAEALALAENKVERERERNPPPFVQ